MRCASEPVSFQYSCDLCAALDPAKPASIDAVRLRVVLSTDSLLAVLSRVLFLKRPQLLDPTLATHLTQTTLVLQVLVA